MLDSDEFEICKEVITKRQKPSRFAEVDRICWEVTVSIFVNLINEFIRSNNNYIFK